MTWFQLPSIFENVAQLSVERVLNSLPEGLLIAFFAWLLLRVVGRQNAGTRFAVWITALVAVAGLPFFGSLRSIFGRGHMLIATGNIQPEVKVPLFWIVPICVLWAVGAGIATARLIVGLWHVRTIRKSCAVIDLARLDPSLQKRMQEALENFGVSRPVVFAESQLVRVPAAIGFQTPMIVFPSWTLQELSPDEMSAILIHELAHVRRRDDWTNLFQKIVRAIFFFHPAVWWIDSRLSLEREMACDDAVLAETGNPRAYASCLVDLLEKSCVRRGWVMAQTAVHRAHEASLRIAQILDPRRRATTSVGRFAPILAGVFSILCIGVLFCAPRLVAFTSEDASQRLPNAENNVEMGAMSTDTLPTAAVVPTTFHIRGEAMRPAIEKSATHHRKHATIPLATVERNSKPGHTVPRAVMAKAEQQTRSTASMLVLVEATEIEARPLTVNEAGRVPSGQMQKSMTSKTGQNGDFDAIHHSDSNDMTWRIQVWRLVFMSPTQAELQSGVIGKAI